MWKSKRFSNRSSNMSARAAGALIEGPGGRGADYAQVLKMLGHLKDRRPFRITKSPLGSEVLRMLGKLAAEQKLFSSEDEAAEWIAQNVQRV